MFFLGVIGRNLGVFFVYRDSASLHFASQGIGRRLGITNKFVLLSACSDIPACILSSRWDYVRTAVLCRGCIPACIITSLRDLRLGDVMVTLLWSSIWSNVRLQGLKPLPVFCRPYGTIFRTAVLCRGYTPACILSSLWDYFRTTVLCRGDAPMEFGAEWAFYTGTPLQGLRFAASLPVL